MYTFLGKTIKSPVVASSCIATENEENILRLADNGIEAVILKSCSPDVCGTTEEKREFAADISRGLMYASSPYQKEILNFYDCIKMLETLRKKTNLVLVPSLALNTLNPMEWLSCCEELEEAGADGIQLDFFYMGNLFGIPDFPILLECMLGNLLNHFDLPVMPKLNINLPKYFILPLLAKAGIEYVSLLDSVRVPYFAKKDGEYTIDKRLNPNMTSCFGGWQLPLTLSYTYTAKRFGLNVCAGSGITCADDVKLLMAAGADTVQSATYVTKAKGIGELF